MGLLNDIIKEKELKTFFDKELSFIEKNIIPSSVWNDKVNEIKEIIKLNTLTSFEKAKSILTEPFENTYWDINIKGILKEHIIFEKNCNSIIEQKKIKELELKELREKLHKLNNEIIGKNSDDFLDKVVYILSIPFLFPVSFIILLIPTIYLLVAAIKSLIKGNFGSFIFGLFIFLFIFMFFLLTVITFFNKIKVIKLQKKIKRVITELSEISTEIKDKCSTLIIQ